MVFKRTVIKTDEIISLESKFYKGDKIFTGDCFFYTLKLKNGAKITFTLYAYGEEAEKEIWTIENNMNYAEEQNNDWELDLDEDWGEDSVYDPDNEWK